LPPASGFRPPRPSGRLRSDLIDPTIAVHHGRVVKRTGDGAIVEFRSVVDAVNCAIEVQRAMVERNAEVAPDKRIEFRIAIHLGDVVEESDGDLMGEGVNIAARLESMCEPGAICLSEQAYWQVKGRLDLAVRDLGPKNLKNIAEPVRVYSLEVGKPAQAKPVTAATPLKRAPEPKKRTGRALLAAALAALLILIAGGAWWFLSANRPASIAAKGPAEAARLSIAVLPFANLSGDPGQEYLADALTDELTTALARIRDSFVIARNTAFTYKGKPVDAKAVGKDLGVRYVLEGSVQPSAHQVRINAQLIDADSGAHLWAEQFDTPRADLLQMQDEIVTHLARAIDLQLPEVEAARFNRARAANPDAEDLALQCVAAMQKAGYTGKDADAGSGLCERALATDPNNVRALTSLAIKKYFWAQHHLGNADLKTDLDPADELASRALALDRNYARAHSVKGSILFGQGRFDEAITEHERALALDPAMVPSIIGLGWNYLSLGQTEKGLEFLDKAIRLSPHDPALDSCYNGKAWGYFPLKQYDQTIEWARRALAISPRGNPWIHLNLIAALALAGHEAEAHDALQNYLASVPSWPETIAAWRVAAAPDRYYEGLRKAGMPEE
jgi:TolB-like protein/Tfp pilus assembly protein PilF